MAAPIAHLFLAIQMLNGPFKGKFNEQEFLVGTSFPDIRYLKVVPRTETHFINVTLEDILQETDSFRAGMLFHSFVDEKREAFIVAHDLYNKISDFRFASQSLKFAEDEILREIFDVSVYQSLFDKLYPGEKGFNISARHVQCWHRFLQDYFDKKFSCKELIIKYFNLNEPNAWFIKRWLFSWFYARKMNQAISTLVNNSEVKELILKFYTTFVQTFS